MLKFSKIEPFIIIKTAPEELIKTELKDVIFDVTFTLFKVK
jgi:hypothetical protein